MQSTFVVADRYGRAEMLDNTAKLPGVRMRQPNTKYVTWMLEVLMQIDDQYRDATFYGTSGNGARATMVVLCGITKGQWVCGRYRWCNHLEDVLIAEGISSKEVDLLGTAKVQNFACYCRIG